MGGFFFEELLIIDTLARLSQQYPCFFVRPPAFIVLLFFIIIMCFLNELMDDHVFILHAFFAEVLVSEPFNLPVTMNPSNSH